MLGTRRGAGGFALGAVFASAAAAAQTPARGSNLDALNAFVRNFQRAVDRADRRTVAAMVRYPIRVLASGLTIPISNTSEMVQLYDIVFTQEMRCAIVGSRMAPSAGPKPAHATIIGDEGVSIASGLVWAQVVDNAFKVTRFIVPPGGTPAKQRRTMHRVDFPETRRAPSFARFSGVLNRDDIDLYVLSGTAGQNLNASIDGFRGRDALLQVIDSNGKSMPSNGQRGERTWIGRLPSTGTYRVEVARHAPYCAPALLYSLVMSLK